MSKAVSSLMNEARYFVNQSKPAKFISMHVYPTLLPFFLATSKTDYCFPTRKSIKTIIMASTELRARDELIFPLGASSEDRYRRAGFSTLRGGCFSALIQSFFTEKYKSPLCASKKIRSERWIIADRAGKIHQPHSDSTQSKEGKCGIERLECKSPSRCARDGRSFKGQVGMQLKAFAAVKLSPTSVINPRHRVLQSHKNELKNLRQRRRISRSWSGRKAPGSLFSNCFKQTSRVEAKLELDYEAIPAVKHLRSVLTAR